MSGETAARRRVVGIDFDNTIADYGEAFYHCARHRDLVGPEAGRSKAAVRAALRQRPGGEEAWQQVQAEVYGPRLAEAAVAEGLGGFLGACRRRGVAALVVSHKTRFASGEASGTDLRQAALAWMGDRGFFAPDGFGLTRQAVFFEGTRRGKVERIRQLGCTHFVDDLPEVFLEAGFPEEVTKILYAPDGPAPPGLAVARSWREVAAIVFGP